MPPSPLPDGDACSADELNAQIRALWVDPSVRLTDERRREYEALVLRWEAATRSEVVKAA
ncbi:MULTISPECIES: hypothetical protein [Streptomyces]|uniref:Uncharacterized protein n=1 Tax=Streptomyces dengpaensis TaxID=2049881 RepID=A0ABN5IAN8_9ACTN|nr:MULTISPECIES: hypothetical protein [Streptomyces]AVH60036.1 hypothetical protein C4B68_34360 [Streptomyces dengpaensis]PIB09675.1 hypothetical protein B1C81_11040 [Streptomyces sp. HG99]